MESGRFRGRIVRLLRAECKSVVRAGLAAMGLSGLHQRHALPRNHLPSSRFHSRNHVTPAPGLASPIPIHHEPKYLRPYHSARHAP
jgi:hypothetical protein